MDDAASCASPSTLPGPALPVAPGTVIVVDAAVQLSADHLVTAAVDLLPALAASVKSVHADLDSLSPSSPAWRQQLAGLELKTGALALVQRLLHCLDAADPGWVDHDAGCLAGIVKAAVVVDAIGPARWVCPYVPAALSGTGLPASLPAAVARLCLGALLRTDVPLEARITLDGAALMTCLDAFAGPAPSLGRLIAQGCVLSPNGTALRLILLSPPDDAPACVAVIGFDIDDQSPEDLAIGLDRVRSTPGVLSATVAIATGKKGRMTFRVEVLARPDQASDAIRSCLSETTTIGLRWHLAQRVTLPRTEHITQGALGVSGGVKTVVRPGGQCTTKVEADVLAAAGLDLAGRSLLRADLELNRPG